MAKTKPTKTDKPRKQPTRIKALREKGVVLSQEMLGRLLTPPLDGTSVSRHESGDRAMTTDYAQQYAAIFKVPTHALFLELPTEEPADAKS